MIILPYFFLQTEFGAKYASQLISQNDNYHISAKLITHSIAKPYELTLEEVTIQDTAQTTTYLMAKKLIIGLKRDDLLQTQSFDYMIIEQGLIQSNPINHNFTANILQLKNVSLHYMNPEQQTEIKLENIYGGAKPWSTKVISERADSQFNFTIATAHYNQLVIQSLLIQGGQKDRLLNVTNIGGNIKQGFFNAKATLLANNELEINQLKINNLNIQSPANLAEIEFDILNQFTSINIQHLSVINSSIASPSLLIEKANLDLKYIRYNRNWQLENSDLIFNAQSIVWQDELIENPLLQWKHNQQTTVIEQLIASWQKGSIKLTGIWQDQQLIINNLIASGIRYQLPDNWYEKLAKLQLPSDLPNITIKQFMLMPSLIIDTNPDLPFQLSAFEAFGSNINIINANSKPEITGTISIKADNATLNTVELKNPDLTLAITPTSKDFTFSSLTEQGFLEGSANLSSPYQIQNLTFSAYAIDSEILPLWYLIKNPIHTNKFTITLAGELQPLSLAGSLHTTERDYPIKNNQLINH